MSKTSFKISFNFTQLVLTTNGHTFYIFKPTIILTHKYIVMET